METVSSAEYTRNLAMKVEVAGLCETLLSTYQTTRCHIAQEHNLNRKLWEDEISYKGNPFILVINQLDAQNLFYNKFISCLYMFRAPCGRPVQGCARDGHL